MPTQRKPAARKPPAKKSAAAAPLEPARGSDKTRLADRAAEAPKPTKPPAKTPPLVDRLKVAEPPKTPRLTAHPTQDGVWLNEAGVFCDSKGVALSLKKLRAAERELDDEIDEDDSPAKYLRRISLDPRVPMVVRVDAAKAAAPYFDKKRPQAIEQEIKNNQIDYAALAALPREKREAMLEMLKLVGIDLTSADPGAKK